MDKWNKWADRVNDSLIDRPTDKTDKQTHEWTNEMNGQPDRITDSLID